MLSAVDIRSDILSLFESFDEGITESGTPMAPFGEGLKVNSCRIHGVIFFLGNLGYFFVGSERSGGQRPYFPGHLT
jgi:hypothetical protein